MYKKAIIYLFFIFILILIINFSNIKQGIREISKVEVEVKDTEGNYFIDNLEIMSLMTDKHQEYLLGAKVRELNQRELEARVAGNPFVKEVEIFRDLKGILRVEVEQSRPIGRIFTNQSLDKYIDMEGKLLPTHAKYTARVPLIESDPTFEWGERINESEYGKQFLELLLYINENKFWKAQVAQIRIHKNGDIELFPQVTKQIIDFGRPIEIERKFSKLMIFYKKILPNKGWNTYKKVNLKYKNQIICQ